jgi:hypothetical protein
VSKPERHVRGEAADLRFDELTAQQKEAAKKAHQLLASFLALPWQEARPPKWYYRPWVDGHRGNSAILLDGGRGSGKTSVLLTLVYRWTLNDWPKGVRNPREGLRTRRGAAGSETPREPTVTETPEAWWFETRFVPLDVIDLRVLPDHASLLMRIASAFYRITEELREGQTDAREPLESPKLWRELARTIAYGWDANVRERRSQIDPELYMLELEDAERRGSDVSSHFRAFLDALHSDFVRANKLDRDRRKGETHSPLFIVPIDDADMNPRRIAELVELMRVVWHPAVAFLMTGDSELFVPTLRAHLLGELHENLRELRLPAGTLDLVGSPEHASRLAQAIYDRTVPAQHRCELPPIPPECRRTTKLSARAGIGPGMESEVLNRQSGEVRSLAEALSRITLQADATADRRPPAPPGYSSLDEYFVNNHWLAAALPGRLRSIVDLIEELSLCHDRDTEGDDPPTWMRAVRALWRRAVDASLLSPDHLQALRAAVHLDGREVVVFGDSFVTRASSRALLRLPGPPSFWGSELVLEEPAQVSLLLKVGATTIALSEELSAVVMLVCDLAADGHGYFIGSSPAKALAASSLVSFDVDLPSLVLLPKIWGGERQRQGQS